MKQIIQTEQAPRAVGPYSQAVEANGFVFVSGQLGLNPATGKFVSGNVVEQAEQCLKNVSAVLASAGCTLNDVVKATVYLKSIKDFAAVNAVYGKYFTEDYPARAAFQVAALPLSARVEIEVIAAKERKA